MLKSLPPVGTLGARSILATIVVLGMLMALVATSAAGTKSVQRDSPDCPDYQACFWNQMNFNGLRFRVPAGEQDGNWHESHGARSAKNRFGNRPVKFGNATSTGGVNMLGCLSPGENNNNLWANADVYKVGAQGINCP